jgi:diphthamide synthase (EF-2-diphthine--ammonia ligase)
LELLGIDACGENGEFHTLVVDCPLFAGRLAVTVNDVLHHGNYWFAELI